MGSSRASSMGSSRASSKESNSGSSMESNKGSSRGSSKGSSRESDKGDKMMYYQQGDVLLFIEKELPKRKRQYLNTNIIQHGEATGHAHRIHSEEFKIYDISISDWKDDETEKWIDLYQGGTISHEEHKSIELPKGIYRIGIVREYDHFKEETRKVID